MFVSVFLREVGDGAAPCRGSVLQLGVRGAGPAGPRGAAAPGGTAELRLRGWAGGSARTAHRSSSERLFELDISDTASA